jgi:site-specific recombinase XerD
MPEKNHLEAFSKHLLGLGKSRATANTYVADVKMLLKFVNKDNNPTAITYKDVESYLRDMKSRLAKTSWRHYIFGIKLWLKYIKVYHDNNTIDHFETLPKEMNLLRPPKTREEKSTRPIESLTQAEQQNLYDASKSNPRDYAMLRVFFVSLQRCGSVLNINVEDINFEKKEIHIYAKGDEQYTIGIDDEKLQAIRDYINVREQPKEGFILDNWGRKRYHKDSLFLNGSGKRPTHNLATLMFKNLAVKCHIQKRVFPHLARHQGITTLLDQGIPIKSVALQSGHQTMEVLMKYHHPRTEETKQRIVDMLTKTGEQPLPPSKPNQPEQPSKKLKEHDTTDQYIAMAEKIKSLEQQVITLRKQNSYDVSIQ